MGIEGPVVRLALGCLGRGTRAALVAAVLLATLLAVIVGPTASSHSAGIVGQTRNGCTCHNSTESTAVVPSISGLPGQYTPGRTYHLRVTASGGTPPGIGPVAQGGFDLQSSAGVLEVPKGSSLVRVDPATGEATHTAEGSRSRNWTVEWRAPGRETGQVTFTLVVNTVNGDGAQMPGDSWGRVKLTSEPATGGGVLDVPLFWKVLGTALLAGVLVGTYYAVQGVRIEGR
jgi:hypothetical protein